MTEVQLRANWISALLYRRRILMKQLTKEQLVNLVNDNCKEMIKLNKNGMTERILNSIKGSGDNCSDLMIKLVVAYGAEIMQACNQVFAETLYNILYTE